MVRHKESNFFGVEKYSTIIDNGIPTLVVCMTPKLSEKISARGDQYLILNTVSFIAEIKAYCTTRASTSKYIIPLPGIKIKKLGIMPLLESKVVDNVVNGILRLYSDMRNQRWDFLYYSL